MRQLPNSDYYAMKGNFRRLIKRVGGLENAADITRVCKSTLSRGGSTEDQNMEIFPTIDVVADLESEAGSPIVTGPLAEMSDGYRVPNHAQPEDITMCHLNLVKELGEVSEAISKALEDGEWSDAELRSAQKEIQDVLRLAEQMNEDINDIRASRRSKVAAE